MELDRKCFIVTWRIENYNFCFQTKGDSFYSPSFVINSIKDTSWNLEICPIPEYREENVLLYVNRVSGPKAGYKLDFQISFFADDSSTFYEKNSHIDSDMDYTSSCYAPYSTIYTLKRGSFLPPKILTVRCRISNSMESFADAEKCFIRTRIRVERTAFTGLVEKFGTLVPDVKRFLLIKSSSTEKQLLILNMSLAGDLCCKERVWIEILPVNKDYMKFCKCKLFLLDSEGKMTECGRSEFFFKDTEPKEWKFPLNFTKGLLMKKNTHFLSNDTLALKCEFAFSTDTEYALVEDSEIGNLPIVDNNQPRKFNSALEDMTCLYEEGLLCDMKLRTETETFNVHKNILSARSSVFKTMFITDMREKANDCVHIEDLDAETVRRMLTFLYSDKLEDLDWESAKRLYYAADKYSIVALKYKCSDFLMNNLQMSECCDLLLLSDRHQDEDLKKEVQEYIAKHHEEILISDEWMSLKKSHPVLAVETFEMLYLRNWKK